MPLESIDEGAYIVVELNRANTAGASRDSTSSAAPGEFIISFAICFFWQKVLNIFVPCTIQFTAVELFYHAITVFWLPPLCLLSTGQRTSVSRHSSSSNANANAGTVSNIAWFTLKIDKQALNTSVLTIPFLKAPHIRAPVAHTITTADAHAGMKIMLLYFLA